MRLDEPGPRTDLASESSFVDAGRDAAVLSSSTADIVCPGAGSVSSPFRACSCDSASSVLSDCVVNALEVAARRGTSDSFVAATDAPNLLSLSETDNLRRAWHLPSTDRVLRNLRDGR